MYRTESFVASEFKPARFESVHSITLNGKEIPYRTVCEDNVFYGADGKAIASLFSYSYLRTDVQDKAKRPVIFGYNGGPGCSAMYIHAGFFGTRRLRYGAPDRLTALPPYEMIDNPDCLLDEADLVMIDPVGTGFGVLLDEAHQSDFYGLKQDAEALLTFIEQWLTRYDRWLSPKYLFGESYGCTRNAIAAGLSVMGTDHRAFGVRFDGIVMVGNTVSVGRYFRAGLPAEESVTWFPTFAAINWYHNHPSEDDLETFTMKAKAFADTDYLAALYAGESLRGEERRAIVERMRYFLGVSEDYLENNALRIERLGFSQEVIRHQGKSVSWTDGRMTRPRHVPELVEEASGGDDAIANMYDGFFQAGELGDIHPYLNIRLDRQYVGISHIEKDWDYDESRGSTAELLHQAMTKTPGMRVFFANGWLDANTEFSHIFYTVDHAGLPRDRVCFKGYESGHMLYVGERNCRDLSGDIRAFMRGGMPGRRFG
ncbi:MAG: hypothetical protein Q4F18_10830 [Clostridia bacterium]|nr:hypothetical protein [Clostridia bacterium]